MRRTISGWATARGPIRKKVARAPWRRRMSRTRGVCSGEGPSSKVSATRGPAFSTDHTIPGNARARTRYAHGGCQTTTATSARPKEARLSAARRSRRLPPRVAVVHVGDDQPAARVVHAQREGELADVGLAP